jgi:anti-sigma regulatory factor (Ser/Thr protein kinase)/plasmid stabilization system protein ParE
LSLAAEPVSVPAARRFVSDGLLAWGLDDLLDDATLCVTELAANAALHSSSTFMHVQVALARDALRLSVEDDGVVPPEAITPRPSFPDVDDPTELLLEEEATTGRGLAIVSILASDWGVERTQDGKRVWCEISAADAEHGVRLPKRVDDDQSDLPEPEAEAEPMMPAGWTLVRLSGCPVRLSLRQDEHLDELVRELQLVGSAQASQASQALATELQDLLSGPAHARHMGRRIAQRAAAEGLEVIDIEMAMPEEFSAEVQKLDAAVKAADRLCEEMRLLTLASSDDLRSLRAWMTEEIVRQVREGAAPMSWADWLTRRST